MRSCSPVLIPRRHVRSSTICSSQPVRSCNPDLIPRKHVRSDVPYPRDHAAPSWYLICMWNCCSFPIRSCSPTVIARRHVRSDVPYPWDIAVPSLYLVGMLDLLFRTREILQPRPYTLYTWWICCTIWCSLSVRSCSPVLIRSTILCSEPVRSCSPVMIPRSHVWSVVPNPWDTS